MKCESSSHLIKQPIQACLVSAELTRCQRCPGTLLPLQPSLGGTSLPPSILTPAWTELCPSLLGLREPPQTGLLCPQISVSRGYSSLAELITPLTHNRALQGD